MKPINFEKIVEFNIKFKRQTELKDKKEEQLKKADISLERLEEQLTKLKTKEVNLLLKVPNDEVKIEENRSKQEQKEEQISKKKVRITELRRLYEPVEKRYLKLYSEKQSAIIDLDLKIAQLEDKIDELKKNWDKAAEKLNENYAKMRKLNEDSQEYKELAEENDKHREVMRNNVITSAAGMKLKNELEEAKNMKRILENGEIIEELVKPKEQKNKTKVEEKIEKEPIIQEEINQETIIIEEDKKIFAQPIAEKVQPNIATEQRTVTPKTSTHTRYTQSNVKATSTKEQPIVKNISTEAQSTEKEVNIKPYSEMTVDELKKRQRELFAKIVGEDDYYWRAHHENGMEGHEEDWLDKELKAVREELERRNTIEQQEDKTEEVNKGIPEATSKVSFFGKIKNAFKTFINKFKNRNQKSLPAPERTSKQQQEYVDKANKILEETMSNERIFDARTRAAMRKK